MHLHFRIFMYVYLHSVALSSGKEVPRFTYSSAVSRYAEELKDCYSKLPTLLNTPGQNGSIYNLLLKGNDIKGSMNRRTIFQSHAISSLQEYLFQTKPIALTDICDLDNSSECIVIEGKQCVGKTQLVWELCQRWDEIPALKSFQLILLLDFKCKHLQGISNLQGLIYHCDQSPEQAVIQELSDLNGKQVLIIMDGFEHLSQTITRNHNSFIVKIIEGKVLPKSTKLITATPKAARKLMSNYSLTDVKHIQLLGFHMEHVESYNQQLIRQSLRHNVNVQSLMYLPLSASIVSNFYQKSTLQDQDLPQTLTQYFSLYSFDLISGCLQIDNIISPNLIKDPLRFFDDMHPDVHKKVMLLSELALLEMMSSDVSCYDQFVKRDFVQFREMFVSCSHYKDEKLELRFLNHLLQSFLAAYYISKLDDCEKDQLFFNHSLSEMSDVWRFVAGLSGLTSTILEVLKSSIDDLHHLPFIVGLLHEQHDEGIIRHVFEHSELVTYSLSYPEELQDIMSKCYALGYCIAASNCVWNIDFSSCNLKAEDLKAFVCGITSLECPSGAIHSLCLDGNLLGYDEIVLLLQLPIPILQQITRLGLNSCQLTQESFDCLASSVVPSMPHLQALDVGNNCSGAQDLNKLLVSLADLPELQELDLDNTALELENIVPLNKLLSMTGSTLRDISIGGKAMLLDIMNLLVDTVLTQSSSDSLHISDLDLTPNSDTFTLLETNTNLTRLVFFECRLDLASLATSLCMNTSLKELEIFFPLSNADCDIGSQATVAFSDMLEVNRSLTELSLYSFKPLERRRVMSIVETLKYNRSLEVMQLPYHYTKHFSTGELSIIDSRVCWKIWPCITTAICKDL